MPDALRVLLLSLHTSPLEQPGAGDAGGMNVYVRHLAQGLAAAGHTVDMAVLDRGADALSSTGVRTDQVADGVRLLTVSLPGARGAAKEQLPRLTRPFAEALRGALPVPDVVHAHYWLSGNAGRDLADAWAVPLVLSLHTTARAKNLRAQAGEVREPEARAAAEAELVARAAATVVNTAAEARQMVELYGADPSRLAVVSPGVDPAVFHPVPRNGPRPSRAPLQVLFAGRLQALKGPQILVEAAARARELEPARDLELTVAGVGPADFVESLRRRICDLGLAQSVDLPGALPPAELAERMRRADVVAVPSSSETYGLVALEAQACGTPVLATDVDGLRNAVQDGVTGRLLPDRDPRTWARALHELAGAPDALAGLGTAAARRAGGFSWARTARDTAVVYVRAGVRDSSRAALNTLER